MPGFRGLAAGPGSPRSAPAAGAGARPLRAPRAGAGVRGERGGGGPGAPALRRVGRERLGAAAAGLGAPSPPAGLRAPVGQGARCPARGRAHPPGEEGPPPREQCGRCSAARRPRPRTRPSTPLGPAAAGPAQREEPPYLVLERKGKGYPQMPAALGHRPAVLGPRPGAVPAPAGRWRRRAAPGRPVNKPAAPGAPARGLLCAPRGRGGDDGGGGGRGEGWCGEGGGGDWGRGRRGDGG